MTKLRWSNRKQFIRRCASLAYRSFVEVQNWIETIDPDDELLMNGKLSPSIDLTDIIDELIEGYTNNPEKISTRQLKMAKSDILAEFYELAMMADNLQAKDYACKGW